MKATEVALSGRVGASKKLKCTFHTQFQHSIHAFVLDNRVLAIYLCKSCAPKQIVFIRHNLSSNSNLNLDTCLHVDDDLLNNLGWGVQVDQALVNAHLVEVPGLGTFTVGRLTGGNLQVLGGKANRALDTEVLGLGALNELGADLLERVDLAGGEGDSDLVDLL